MTTTITTIRKDEAMNTVYGDVETVTAGILLHIASKMPYCPDADAKANFDYLVGRFGRCQLISYAGITSWQDLLEKAIKLRAAAEQSLKAEEVTA